MQLPRRSILLWVTGLLVAGNVVLLFPTAVPAKQERVTYVGLDSASYFVPLDRPASTYRQHRWKPGLDETRLAPDPVDYVTLVPEPTLGQFIKVIGDLKQRHRCHVLVHYPGIGIVEPAFGNGESVFDIPVLALCGDPLGDAGNQEPVPQDRFVTVSNAMQTIASNSRSSA